ncbi:hypothetical protein HNY73_016893 [Argiope bruennichi]|uniref:VWFC domain-containing protein n=1 Tax=Argiope bruennichi TaxID=94029 RepID=A0A8T0ELE9_ARGBR|nr:hypothetical protein HNY73_016893 [Argiope bruennichi]
MECRGLWSAWHLVLLFLCSTTSAHYLREPKNETISSQDYGTQNPGQQLSKASNCDCEWRYLKHYEAKGCRPVYEEKPQTTDKPSCTCPWRFDCSQADEIQPNDKVCVYKKHVYPVGSKIPTSNPCETCSCATDYFTQAASISCTTTECPAVYSQTPLPEGCHYVYKEDQCCPISVECPTAQKDNMYQVPACEYKGKMYYEGEQIYPDEDPCLICLCNQNWTGINSSSCRQHDCMLERDARKLKQGCIPIYHEKTCCPIDYHCGKLTGGSLIRHEINNQLFLNLLYKNLYSNGESLNRWLKNSDILDDDFDFKPNRGASFKSDDDEDEMCFFESRYYPIGHVLDIKHPTNCVTCTCKTPPDFTCIHSSCPPPPNNDYTNCKAVYKPHSCCPDYTCEEKTSTLCPDPICKGTNCWLVKQADGCQICRCKSRCMPCPPMCQPENPNNECSGCICQINSTALFDTENKKKEEELNEEKEKDSVQQLIQECKNMQCASDERCMLVQQTCDKEPCLPVPKCEKVSFGCGQSSCPEGCTEIGSYENNCPLCYCKEQIKEPQYKLTCRVQSCEENCILTGRDEEGCPICKCPQGNLEERACASSPCRGFNCTMAVNSLGCAECRCQLSCKPKECPAGCDLDLDVPENSGLECGCQCKNSTTAVEYIHSKPISESCSDVSCNGLNCTVGEDKSGCPYCNCKAPCPAPVCQEGCQIEKTTEPGRCPGCVCKLSRSIRDNKAKECPPPTCLGYNCSVITEDNGCQKCLCESPCEEEPQCPAHCKLETNVPEGRCRGCVCSFGEQADLGTTNNARGGGAQNSKERKLKAKPGNAKGFGGPIHSFAWKRISAWSRQAFPDPRRRRPRSVRWVPGTLTTKKDCPEGQKCVIRRLQCIRTPCPTIPVCIDVEPRCPIPMCAIGCMVMKWDDEVCPSCFCGIIRGAEGRVCPRTRCMGRRCYNVIGDDGCPQCKCDSICIPPKCYDGCYVEKDPPPGKCPTCTCPDRHTVEQPIIPGTSPADNATGPIIDHGSENENLEESSTTEGTEKSDINLETTEATDDIQERNPGMIADEPSPSSHARPESGDRNKLLDEDIADDFYNSLAEIEEQVKSAELTTVTVNLPTTIDEADILNISTATASEESNAEIQENHFTTEAKVAEESTTSSSAGESATEQEVPNFALNYAADEAEPTPVKPCMLKPNVSDDEEEEAGVPQELITSTEEPIKFSLPEEEKDIVIPTATNPPQVPSTRRPQRRPVLSRPVSNTPNKNTANRLKPQNVNNKVKPRPHATSTVQTRPLSNTHNEYKRPSSSQSSSSSSSYGSKPVSKPQVFDPYLDETDPDDMKPILENLQQLMSNLHHVLASHQNQRPTNLEEAFHNLQSSLNAPTKVQESQKPNDVKHSPQHSSVAATISEHENGNKEKINNTQHVDKLESIEESPEIPKKDPVPQKESAEKYSEQDQKLTADDITKNVTEEEKPSQSPQNEVVYQNDGAQQQYFVNPPILPHQQQSIQNQQVVPTILHQGMQSQFHVYPQFQYQTSQSNLPGIGMQPQYPYQNHLQSIYTGGQAPIFSSQPQGPYYPSIQHPSFITNVNPFQSETFGQTQPNKQHLLLTNIPIPPSLQQQLNAGTQTLGFLQHLFGPNNPFYQQQLLQMQQHNNNRLLSSDIKPIKNEENKDESNLSDTSSSSNVEEISKLEVQEAQQQNIFSNVQSSSESPKDEKAESQQSLSSTGEQTLLSFSQTLQQDKQKQQLISSEQESIPVQEQHETNSSAVVSQSNHLPSVQYLDQNKDETSTELPPMPAFPLLLDSLDSKEKNGSISAEKFENQEIHSSTSQPDVSIQFNHHAPQQPQTTTADNSTPAPSASSLQNGTSNQQQQIFAFNAFSPHQQLQHLENIAQQYQDLQERFKQQQQLQHLESIVLQYQQLQEQYDQIQAALQKYALIPKNSSKPLDDVDGEMQQSEQSIPQYQIQILLFFHLNNRINKVFNNSQENAPPSINSNVHFQSTEGKDSSQQTLVHQNYISNHNVPFSGQQQQVHQNVPTAGQMPFSQQGTIAIEQTNSQNTALPYQQQQTHDQTQYNLQGVPFNQQQSVNQHISFGLIPPAINEQIVQQPNQQAQSNAFEANFRPQQSEQQQQTNYIPNQSQTSYQESINVAIPNILPSQQSSTSQISDPSSFVVHTQHTHRPQNVFGQDFVNHQLAQPQLINNQEPLSTQTDTNFPRPIMPVATHINQQQAQNHYEVIEQGLNNQPGISEVPVVQESSIQQQNTYFQYRPASQQQTLHEQNVVHSTQHFINSHYKPIIQQNNITQNFPFNQQQNYLTNQPISATQQFVNADDKTEIQLKVQNETNLADHSINAYDHITTSQHVQQPPINVNAGWNYAQQQANQQISLNSQDNKLDQNQQQVASAEIKPILQQNQNQNNFTSTEKPIVDPYQSQQQYLQQHVQQQQTIQHQQTINQQYLVPQQTGQQQQFGPNLAPLGAVHQQQYLQPHQQIHQQYFASNERPLTDLYQNQQQHYILGERPLPETQQGHQQVIYNQNPIHESQQGQQQYIQHQTYQQHQFISNEQPLPGSYPIHQQYQTHIHQQTGLQQQQYIPQQQNIPHLNQPPVNLQQQQNIQQQYFNANEKPIPAVNIQQQFVSTPELPLSSVQQQHVATNEQPIISSPVVQGQHQTFSGHEVPAYQVHQSQYQQPQIMHQQQFVSNVHPPTLSQHVQYQQQQPTQHDEQNVQSQHFNANDKPLLPSQFQHQQQHAQQQYLNANEKPPTFTQVQQQFSSAQHSSTYGQSNQQQQNVQQHAVNVNQNAMHQNNQQYFVSHEAPISPVIPVQDKIDQIQNISIHANRPLIQSQQASTSQEQGHVNVEQFSDPNETLHQQFLISDNNDPSQQEFIDQGDLETQFSDENADQIEYSSNESENQQAQDNIQVADSSVQQHNIEDKYSALKPIAQIITAETQSNQQNQNEDNLSILGPNEAAPIQQVLENLKNNGTSELHSQSIPQEPPVQQVHISTHGLKTRPGAVVRPHFPIISSTTTTTTSAPSEHDLFPAPSRPINNKPEIQQQDWFDQEFVEDDVPQESEVFEYDDFEEPESTTIVVTEQSLDPYRQPIASSTKRPVTHFSRPTPAQQPLQHEIIENFDNHQPDSIRKPIDQQQIIDEFKSTSQKYFFQRTSTTPRPFTSDKFTSFSTVSPTAEAYSVSKYPTKTPLSPIPSYQCPTPHCNGYNCSLIRGSDGCQKCVCDSPCAPCPQHCVKTKTLSEGRCPICDCTVAPPVALATPVRHCPPVDCSGKNCRNVRDNDGCMTCICDPKCVEPQCDPGCEILRDVPPGQCPGCVCKVTVVQAVIPRPRPCSPVTCGKNCKETRGPDGCPQCVCHAECPPLKCDPGCTVQNDVAAGNCPTCVCSNYADDDDDDDDDLYCPNLFCSEYGCREVPGPAGCPICMCDPVCKTPVCDPGCQVISDKYHGRCPVCLCSNPINGTSASEPIKSEESIKTVPVIAQQEQQVPVTFSGVVEAVVAEEETTESTLHTTVTVELETEPYTEEPTTTEATTTTTESPTCPAPVCSGLRCSMEMGDDGCEVCKCKYKCPKPKCVGSCYAETNAPSHRCPGCVCPSRSKPSKY